MEIGGMKVDEDRRQHLRSIKGEELERESKIIQELVDDLHKPRRTKVQEEIGALQIRKKSLFDRYLGECPSDPDYAGKNRRNNCACCARVYARAEHARQESKELTSLIAKRRTEWNRQGDVFRVGSDKEWRWLLFQELKLKPPPGSKTDTGLIRVDARTIEKMQRKYPDVEVLKHKVKADKADYCLRVPLKVPVDDRGFAHCVLSQTRTSTLRIASGTNDDEPGKKRLSEAGNLQNLNDQVKSIYIGDTDEDGVVCWDYKNIEALITAALAGEWEMVEAIIGDGDIHAQNGLLLASAIGFDLDPALVDVVAFPYDPGKKSFRQNGKLTHKWHYGMKKFRMREDYGIPTHICTKLINAYFNKYQRILAWQEGTAKEANKERKLVSPYGAAIYFHNLQQNYKTGKWEVDREQALAWKPQHLAAMICQTMLPKVEALCEEFGGRIIATTHDSYAASCPKNNMGALAKAGVTLLQQPHPLQPRFEKGGEFWCPVKATTGLNWADYHKHDQDCAKYNCSKIENLGGQRK
jgi:DNA polymerase I-like protein with 3'-5' exonuclease and polymerase domains